jgi:TatD DNase family protein
MDFASFVMNLLKRATWSMKLVMHPMFFDTHCHFDFAEFDVDRIAIWQHCDSLGVKQLVIPGVEPKQWSLLAGLCEEFSGIGYSVGLHPYWIDAFVNQSDHEDVFSRLYELLLSAFTVSQDKNEILPIAIGECGLDKTIGTAFDLQQSILVIIHCVKAHAEFISQLKNNQFDCSGVIHAFSGSVEIAKSYIDLGFMLGVGGVITYDRAHKTRETLCKTPLEFLVLETDAPDMPLQGMQVQRNSPENIPLIAQVLAELRGESLEKIAEVTYANAIRLFSK